MKNSDIRFGSPIVRPLRRRLAIWQLLFEGLLLSGSVRVVTAGPDGRQREAGSSGGGIRWPNYSMNNGCPIHRWYENRKRDREGRVTVRGGAAKSLAR